MECLGEGMMKWMRGLVLSGLCGVWAGALAADEGRQSASWMLMREGGAALPVAGAMAPESLSEVLGLLYQGAGGETAAQMQGALFGGESAEAVEAEMGRREKTLNGYRTLHGIWRSRETVLAAEFADKAATGWGVHLGVWADKSSSEERVAEINRWFDEQTRGTVNDVISAEELGEDGAFCGVLLAAFAAPWAEDVFAVGATRRELFYATAAERFEVSMMGATARMKYAEDEDFQFVRIEYAGSKIGLYLMLPKRAAEAESAFAKLDGRRWQTLTAAMKQRLVTLRLPKVSVSEQMNWQVRLTAGFGVTRPFAAGVADFSKLGRHPEGPLYLRSLVQRVSVRWDERGTRAEAVTTYGIDPFGDAPKQEPEVPVAFVANHPFAYVIGDVAEGRVLFAGRISRREQMP